MADIKWSAFTSGSTIAGSDNVVGLQGGANVIWTWGNVLTYINSNAQITEGQVTNLSSDLAALQPLNAALTSISGLTTTSNEMIYLTGSNTYATTPFTSFAGSLVSDANAAAAQATLALVPGTNVQAWYAALDSIGGLTTSANQMIYTTGSNTYATTSATTFGRSLLADTNASAAQTTLALVPGTNVQAFSAALASIAGLTTAANEMIYLTGSNTYATTSATSFGLSLLADANSSAAQTTLALVPGTNVQAFNAALASIAGLTTAANEMIYLTGSNTYATTPFTSFAGSLVSAANSSAAQTTLALVPGTNVQAFNAALASISGLTTSADQMIYTTGSNTYTTLSLTAYSRTLLPLTTQNAWQVALGILLASQLKNGTTAANAGASATIAFTATGLTSASCVTASVLSSTIPVAIYSVVPSTDTLTVTFSAPPGSGTVVNWIDVG